MQVNIRIRDDLYKKLREEAKNWHRTITAQLEIILSEALETQEKNYIETQDKKHRRLIENYNNNHNNNIVEDEEDPYNGWR